MARRHARRQIGEKRRDFGGNGELGVGAAHAGQILVAGLLHDREPRPQGRFEEPDRGGHDIGHDAGALAAAENQQPQRIARRRIGRRRGRDDRRPHRIAGQRRLGGEIRLCAKTSGNVVAIAVTRGANNRLARPITALASWIRLGTPRQAAASSGGTSDSRRSRRRRPA